MLEHMNLLQMRIRRCMNVLMVIPRSHRPSFRALVFTLAVGMTMFGVSISNVAIAHASDLATSSCSGSNLVGALVSKQVVTGHEVTTIAVTNVGSSACSLRGYPGLVGLKGSERRKLRVTKHGTYGGNLEPAVLAPRMSGALIIGTGDLCAPYYGVPPAGHTYSGLILVLPGNKGDVIVVGVAINTSCYLAESRLGWRRNFSIMGT